MVKKILFILLLTTNCYATDTILNNSGNLLVTNNIGIGTTNPLVKLDVRGDLNVNALAISSITGGAYTDCWIGKTQSGNVDWLHIGGITHNGVRRTMIASGITYMDGNVGIGTTTPGAKLSFGVFEGKSIHLWEAGDTLRYGMGINSSEMQFFVPTAAHMSFNGGGDLQSSGTNEIVRINGSGNVGIGTTAPGAKLDISPSGVTPSQLLLKVTTGTTAGTSPLCVTGDGNVGLGTTVPAARLHLKPTVGFGAQAIWIDNNNDDNGSANRGIIGVTHPSDYYGDLYLDTKQNGVGAIPQIWFGINGTEAMRIDTNRNVGIGTSAPSSKLYVYDSSSTAGAYTSKYFRFENEKEADNSNALINGDFSTWVNPRGYTFAAAYGVRSLLARQWGNLTYGYAFIGQVQGLLNYQNFTNGVVYFAQSPYFVTNDNLSNAFGLYVEAQKASGVGTGWGIYTAGSSDYNYFAGNVGIGITGPGAKLDIRPIAYSGSQSGGIQLATTTGEWLSGLFLRSNAGGMPRMAIDIGGTEYLSVCYSSTTGLNAVGIGTTMPQQNLDVRGNTFISGTLKLGNTSTDANDGVFASAVWVAGLNIVGINSDSTFRKVAIWGQIEQQENSGRNYLIGRTNINGNVGIGADFDPSYNLQLYNDSAGKPNGGSWANSSDRRIKKNIKHLENALDKIMKLKPVSFEYINPEIHSKGIRQGFIAQDVEKVFPNFVSEIEASWKDKNQTNNGKIKSLNLPFDFDAYVIKAIQELKEENEVLKIRIRLLENK